MPAITPYIRGTDLPAQPPKAAQRAAIHRRAKASEAVVNVLCELAFGPCPDWIWASAPGALQAGMSQAPYAAPCLEAAHV